MRQLFRRCARAAAAAALSLLPALSSSGAATGAGLSEELQVNLVTDGIQQSASVALAADGDFVVAWQSEVAGRGDEIRARRFAASGAAQGEEIAVNTLTAGDQDAPAVARAAGGDFVVVWQSLVANNFVIRARRFDARGVAQGEELAVNTSTGDAHSAPAVAMAAGGDFVVVWETALHGSYEIRARRFSAAGVAQGGEIAVNTLTASSQRAPAVAMAADGGFVVAWRSNVAGSFEVRAQRFTVRGVSQGGELVVNRVTAGDQLAPSVAMDARGDFVVAWENSFEGNFEIRARRFTALGVPSGAEFAVNPATAGDQFAPAVALSAGGDFVVAWHSLIAGSSEIRARGFTASGVARSEELAINTVTARTQKAAAVALGADGGFVVAWHSDATGSWEIAARRQRLRRGLWAGGVSGLNR